MYAVELEGTEESRFKAGQQMIVDFLMVCTFRVDIEEMFVNEDIYEL